MEETIIILLLSIILGTTLYAITLIRDLYKIYVVEKLYKDIKQLELEKENINIHTNKKPKMKTLKEYCKNNVEVIGYLDEKCIIAEIEDKSPYPIKMRNGGSYTYNGFYEIFRNLDLTPIIYD